MYKIVQQNYVRFSITINNIQYDKEKTGGEKSVNKIAELMINFDVFFVFCQILGEHTFLALWSKHQNGCSGHNSGFFHCWSFPLFKRSVFIGPLHRPCPLFFTPFTPWSLGCLQLHFTSTSITWHRSKWSGWSSVSAICLFNKSLSSAWDYKVFFLTFKNVSLKDV